MPCCHEQVKWGDARWWTCVNTSKQAVFAQTRLFAHMDASASQALSIQAALQSGLPGHRLPANPEAGMQCRLAGAHWRCSVMPGIAVQISILGYATPEAATL